MRRATLVAVALLLAGCGNGTDPEPPEVSIQNAEWAGDEIVVEAATNLPDGAILTFYVLAGDDWDDDTATDDQGYADVADGTATFTADTSAFGTDAALVEVTFVPNYREQPDEVRETYSPNQGAQAETTVIR